MTGGAWKSVRKYLPWFYTAAGLVFIGQWIWVAGTPTYKLGFGVLLTFIGVLRLALGFVKRPKPERLSLTDNEE